VLTGTPARRASSARDRPVASLSARRCLPKLMAPPFGTQRPCAVSFPRLPGLGAARGRRGPITIMIVLQVKRPASAPREAGRFRFPAPSAQASRPARRSI
jgi:hypothetical protein